MIISRRRIGIGLPIRYPFIRPVYPFWNNYPIVSSNLRNRLISYPWCRCTCGQNGCNCNCGAFGRFPVNRVGIPTPYNW